MARRAIYRQRALDAYRRGLERDVLPRLTPWPVVASLWLLTGLLLLLALLAWLVRIPAYADGVGVVSVSHRGPGAELPAIVLYVPATQAAGVRAGQSVSIRIEPGGRSLGGWISEVRSGIVSPATAAGRLRKLGIDSNPVVDPSVAVVVRTHGAGNLSSYTGSAVNAQVRVGSQSLLRMVTTLGTFLEGS